MLDSHLKAKTRPQVLKENTFVAGDVRISVLGGRLFRIEKGDFCDEATQTVWFRDMPKQSFSAKSENGVITVSTDDCRLCIEPDLSGYVLFGRRRVSLQNSGNLLGTYRTLDGCDGSTYLPYDGSKPYEIELENGVCSKSGVAVLDDSKSLILKADGSLSKRSGGARDIYVFAFGRDYRAAVRALYMISGKTPIIPRFALGNWWSRYYAYTEKQYLDLLERFSERDIPLTVATVDMDWHWSTTLDEKKKITESGKNDEKHGGADGWTGYSWNTDLFPDYRAFLAKIKAKNLRVTLNLHPALGVRWFEDMYEKMCREVGADPETEERIKFDMSDEKFINAYFKVLHKPYERDGVDFWWVDWQQGTKSALEGLDPLWALNHYHTLDIAKEKEPLILSRYCGLGSHRYPLGFSGDTYVTWKTLKYLPYFTATASNAGYSWWSHDIGGHQGGSKDDELYVRFLQFGVFSPINRLHCSCSEVFSKEPMFYMNGKGKIAEDFLRLRHRMIPLLYSAAVDTSESGKALIEPMYYEYPEIGAAYSCPQQYLFADQTIAAPIAEKTDASGMAVVTVFLPEGKWTDVFTGDEYIGGGKVKMLRWLDSLPVLAKEGAIIALDGKKTGNSIDLPECLEVLAFNGNGSFVLHEDRDGQRLDTEFASFSEKNLQQIDIFSAVTRKFRLEFRNIPEGSVSVKRNGRAVKFTLGGDERLAVEFCAKAGETYSVRVRYSEDLRRKFIERLKYNLTRFEIKTDVKNRLYDELSKAPAEKIAEIIAAADIPRRCKDRLRESLGAGKMR